MNRLLVPLGCLTLLAPLSARADVAAWCDDNDTSALVDGMLSAGEYPGSSTGVGGGFGGILGAGVTLAIDGDTSGALVLAIDGSAGDCTWGADDTVVVYLDAIPGVGFGDTSAFSDTGDPGRAAASGMGTDGGRATLTFAPDFGADHAIVIRNDSANLFRLVSAGSHAFVTSLTRGPSTGFDASCVKEVGGVTMSDLGTQAGNPLRWVATLLNSSNGFRSNELQGVESAPAANIGVAPFALSAGDRATFEGAAPPVVFGEGPFVWIDFGTYEGTGFTPDPTCAQLSTRNWTSTGMSDGNLSVGTTNTEGDYARGASAGGVSVGGFWAFTTAPNDTSFGIAPDATDFHPGQVTLRVQNARATNLVGARVSYRALVLNDEGRSSSLDFSYSTGGGSFTTVTAHQILSPEAPDALGWQSFARSTTITGIDVLPGNFLFLRFRSDDVSGTGERDEFAIDDVVIHPIFTICGDGMAGGDEACDQGADNGATPCGCQLDCTFGLSGAACGGGGLGPCDVPDTCDGAGACVDRVSAAGTICNGLDASLGCDADDVCDGTSKVCAPRFASAGEPCAASTGACDLGASCDGSSAACPASLPAADGTPCGDGEVCNGDELCMGGACTSGTARSCDDSDPCTTDSCAEPDGCSHTPVAGCCTGAGCGDAGAGRDAGPGRDAAADDAGNPDAGGGVASAGCACRAGTPSRGQGAGLAALLALALMLRRRRSRCAIRGLTTCAGPPVGALAQGRRLSQNARHSSMPVVSTSKS